MDYFLLFVFSFFNIALLGFQSQIVRDQIVAIAFFTTWGLALVQFFSTRFIVSLDPLPAFLCFGMGSSLGIVFSIFFYRWFTPRFEMWRKSRKSSVLWGKSSAK